MAHSSVPKSALMHSGCAPIIAVSFIAMCGRSLRTAQISDGSVVGHLLPRSED